MTDYSKMSDYEINWRVAEEKGLSVDHNASVILPQTYCGHDENGCKYEWRMRDYCNNPADAWQIIAINRIGLIPNLSNGWYALTVDEDFVSDESNPLRAAMIVFLMMKDAEKC
ncbi:DUF2591 family protein [Serratia ureilytica]|uniref:phage protein NinX family protein n=1 Tax=Serratia ureilytica TaxID=300181 RepID=UPI001F4C98D6|nr:phage protein NinX family protein [Serratia ureilytica]UNE41966.1 DUF2591 family protein [Serratia ureilytica]